MKRHEPQSVGALINQFMQSQGVTDTLGAQDACLLWPSVVGSMIAADTQQRRVDGRTLHVTVTSAVLRHELNASRRRLIYLLNEAVGRSVIDNILFH